MLRKLLAVAAALLVSTSALAQSQAVNGLVEGVVRTRAAACSPE